MSKKAVLIILDGWGIATDPTVSAIDQANTPFVDSLYDKYPHSRLNASGTSVGLPEGQMGNSEVGHMNIGAGRIVYQDLVKINRAVEDRTLHQNETLQDAFEYARNQNKKMHFLGLVSDGGVHSHICHLKGLSEAAGQAGIEYYVHAFTDGRDCDPQSGVGFIEELESHLSNNNGQLASVVGRYYAMDRDKRWERVKLAYDCLTRGKGNSTDNVPAEMRKSYENKVTDEFLKPIVKVNDQNEPLAVIEEGDVVMCFNFRTDRGREITMALTQQDFPDHNMHKMSLYYLTMTNYDDTFQDVKVVYGKDHLNNTMGEILSKKGKKQIRIAETEKYPHVTFFFSGGREEEFDGEKRILCPSPKVATYDLQPEMSAEDVRDEIVKELDKQWADFVCLNFANPDMVGHTGVFEAAVKACETVDQCTADVVNAATRNGYSVLIIADHGNSDIMINPDGSPHTAHTTNLVPCILIDEKYKGSIKDGKLGNIAPTILELMEIDVPEEMDEESLLA